MASRSLTPLPKDEPKTRPMDGVTIRRLLGLARPEVPRLALGMVFLLLGSVSTLFYPKGVQYLVDEVFAKGRMEQLNRAALALLGIFTVQGAATALRYYLFNTSGERVVTRLRDALYRSLVRQEI